MYSPIAVIDIGSNSVRLVIYQQLSDKSFHLINAKKFKVRIGEGAYLKDGYLQEEAIKRAYDALKEFSSTLQLYSNIQTIAVATSALRDAPNSEIFTNLIYQDFKIKIDIIDGKREAFLGAISAKTLLPIHDAITIDIGGGSSDIALIQNKKIVDTYSLNLGTVRLKELFSDKQLSQEEISLFIDNELAQLPKHFKANNVIGIGGTARTLSKAVMEFQGLSLPSVHNFGYEVEEYQALFEKIIVPEEPLLQALKISKNRIDTIREGTIIWQNILNKVEAKEVLSSAVGIREGLFLEAVKLTDSSEPVAFTNLD